MAKESPLAIAVQRGLERIAAQGETLESEGLPFPTGQIRSAIEKALEAHDIEEAAAVLRRGEALLARVSQDWTWVRELLRRADELRAIAATIGVDLQHLDSRVGNPRKRLMSDPLSSGSLEKAAASASLALAVLNDAMPKFCLQEAQQLGVSIRRARDRGEDVSEVARSFSKLLQAVQDQSLPSAAQRLVETRKAVARIPRAPALPTISPREEEEILLEARNLARRLQRIKGKARDAQSAARLMAQVRAALSEERRYGTPEEEIEALALEVDRLVRQRKRADQPGEAPAPRAVEEPTLPAEEVIPHAAASEVVGMAPPAPDESRTPEEMRPIRGSLLIPYVPPPPVATADITEEQAAAARNRTRARSRP
jgi:hypothetical protein